MEKATVNPVIGFVLKRITKGITRTDVATKTKIESISTDTNRYVVVKSVEKKDIGS